MKLRLNKRARLGVQLGSLTVLGLGAALMPTDSAAHSVTGGTPQQGFIDFSASIGASITLTIEGNESVVDNTRGTDADGCDAAGAKGSASTTLENNVLGGDGPAVNDVLFSTANST